MIMTHVDLIEKARAKPALLCPRRTACPHLETCLTPRGCVFRMNNNTAAELQHTRAARELEALSPLTCRGRLSHHPVGDLAQSRQQRRRGRCPGPCSWAVTASCAVRGFLLCGVTAWCLLSTSCRHKFAAVYGSGGCPRRRCRYDRSSCRRDDVTKAALALQRNSQLAPTWGH